MTVGVGVPGLVIEDTVALLLLELLLLDDVLAALLLLPLTLPLLDAMLPDEEARVLPDRLESDDA